MTFKNRLFSIFPQMYIKQKIKDKNEAELLIKGYKKIKKLSLFDDEYYLSKYPKVKQSMMDPLLHYIFFGFDEGKKPNSVFDGVFYKNHYEDVNMNPLIHYALYGIDNNRQIQVKNIDIEKYYDSDKKNILFVVHEKIGTVGGTGFASLDIIQNLDESFNPFILTSDGEDVELWNYNDSLEKIANYNISYSNDFSIIDNTSNIIDSENFKRNLFNKKLAGVYEEILSKLSIDVVHINHLINHSFDLIEIANQKHVPYLINIHDFYYLCPSVHLVNKNLCFCNFDCGDCDGIAIDRAEKIPDIVQIWRKYCEKLLVNAYLNIAPSSFVIDTYREFYPNIDNLKLIEHGCGIKKTHFNGSYEKPIKLLVPGHISPHKGSLLIKEIKKLDKKNNIELHFLGTTIPNLNKYGVNHGRYKRRDFKKIVSDIAPAASLILSTCPESYSYTLTESWACGVPVIATNLGALRQRIVSTGGGWLVDYKNAKKIYDKIINIESDDYQNKIRNVSKIKIKTLEEMSREYNEIYKKI